MPILQQTISLSDFYRVAFWQEPVEISPEALQRMQESFDFLNEFGKDKIIYGINTGFGPMAQYRVSDSERRELQYNLIRSHATGTGELLTGMYVRSAMLARIGTFLQGFSGIHPYIVSLLKEFLNRGIVPHVFEHGSVGASGDLVQLAHIALCLIGEGEVSYKGKTCSTGEVLRKLDLKPIDVYIREGLSITNGTSVMTGIGIVNLIFAKKLLYLSVVSSLMMSEISSSYDDFMSEELNRTKRHPGQLKVAEMLRQMAQGSKCIKSREEELYQRKVTETVFTEKIQSYYSLRCVPQILGPVYDTLVQCELILLNEANSACDNPIVDCQTRNVYHGGNFHGDYVSLEMDKMKIAITKLTMLAERQLNYLCHDRINGILPPFVNMGVLGLNYGMQAAQFTATSTTAECQTLSNPMYVHSIPSNNDNQDIVSMGTNAALITRTVINNSFQVLAIHFMTIVQAVDCLSAAGRLSPVTRRVYDDIRSIFPTFVDDKPMYHEMVQVQNYLRSVEEQVF